MVTSIAKTLVLNRATGLVEINGQPFGYHIAATPFTVTVDPEGHSIVHLPIIVEEYQESTTPAEPVAHPGIDPWITGEAPS